MNDISLHIAASFIRNTTDNSTVIVNVSDGRSVILRY